MKPHPRIPIIRKTIKWGKYGGAAVTVLLVVVWIWSAWWYGAVGTYSQQAIFLSGGIITAQTSRYYPFNAPWECAPLPQPRPHLYLWEWECGRHGPSPHWNIPHGLHLSAPLWPLMLVSVTATVAAWRLDTLARRRAKLNLCAKCGYDRTGILQDAKCPECGEVPVSV